MPAIKADLNVDAGSYEPMFWTFSDPDTSQVIDLTAAGFLVTGAVYPDEKGLGTKLLDLPDATVWRRTSDGKVYFEPTSALSATWPAMRAFYQVEISHPSGEDVRFSEGKFIVRAEFVKD